MKINTNTVFSGNYTIINWSVEHDNVFLENGNLRLDYANILRENDPYLLQQIEDFKTSKIAEYQGKDLEALTELKRKQDIYNTKQQEFRGKQIQIKVNYDYAFANYFQLMLYCLGASDIVNYTETNAETKVKTAFICVDYLYPTHEALIKADNHFIIDYLTNYLP